MATRRLPDQRYLRECFDYDRASGVLRWKFRPPHHFLLGYGQSQAWICRRWNSRMAGKEAGCQDAATGYRGCTLDGQRWHLHRLIWKLVTDDEPPEIDHRDRNRSNNRWDNLRSATSQKNKHNSAGKIAGRLKGISFDKRRSVYNAQIKIAGRNKYLGAFTSAEEAHAAYCKAAQEHFGEFWNPG